MPTGRPCEGRVFPTSACFRHSGQTPVGEPYVHQVADELLHLSPVTRLVAHFLAPGADRQQGLEPDRRPRGGRQQSVPSPAWRFPTPPAATARTDPGRSPSRAANDRRGDRRPSGPDLPCGSPPQLTDCSTSGRNHRTYSSVSRDTSNARRPLATSANGFAGGYIWANRSVAMSGAATPFDPVDQSGECLCRRRLADRHPAAGPPHDGPLGPNEGKQIGRVFRKGRDGR